MIETIAERGKAGRKRHQVAADLRRLAATLSPGDRLPSLTELERRFGVATGTVEAAVKLLRSEGVLESRHGSGTYIARGVVAAAAPPCELETGEGVVASGTLAAFVLAANPFYRACIEQLTVQAAQRDLTVVCRYAGRTMTRDDVLSLEALNPVGFIAFSHTLEWAASELIERGHRAVVVGVPPEGVFPEVPCVYGDNEYGAYLATRRLLDMGHRSFVYAHAFREETDFFGRRRASGHLRALREAGITEPVRTLRAEQIATWRHDPEAVRRYFTGENAPTGILAWIDNLAVELLDCLRGAGLSVPGDISIVSYDNLPLSAHVQPALDTVDPHLDVQIQHALSMLSTPLPKGQVPTAVVTPTLLCRESSARPVAPALSAA